MKKAYLFGSYANLDISRVRGVHLQGIQGTQP